MSLKSEQIHFRSVRVIIDSIIVSWSHRPYVAHLHNAIITYIIDCAWPSASILYGLTEIDCSSTRQAIVILIAMYSPPINR